ncbi:hypothetical protein VPHK391_0013 [Vibrio phage K391]
MVPTVTIPYRSTHNWDVKTEVAHLVSVKGRIVLVR